MKSAAFLFAAVSLAAGVAGPALAQSATPAAPAKLSAPPPPGIDDPGVKAASPERAVPAPPPPPGSSPAEMSATSLPGKPIPLPQEAGSPAPAGRQPPPQVSVRQEGDQTIEEYRQGGRVYMVVVTPKNGVPQTYMVDQSGQLRGPKNGAPVQPAMYKILEWGKSRPAGDSGSSPGGD